jgi:hypothetical protein
MKIKTAAAFLTIIIALAAGTASAQAQKSKQAERAEFTGTGQKLEQIYSTRLEILKKQIADSLPSVNKRAEAAYLKARQAEAAAEARITAAQKRQGEINTAKALVAHATGKWIGDADKGIAQAKAQLEKANTVDERKAAQDQLEKWQKNREEGMDALKQRQEALNKAERDRPTVEKELKEANEALAKAKSQTMQATKDLGLGALLTSDKRDGLLARHTVLSEATPRGLAAFAQQGEAQQTLVEQLLSAEPLMVQMLVADGAKDGKYGEAIQIYSDIQKASSKAREGHLQRLALAVALEHAVPIKQRNIATASNAPIHVNPVNRYLHFEKAFFDGELDPSFKDLTVWDYRMVVDGEEPDEILTWGRQMLRNYRPDHITTSDYGWRYVAAVRTDIRYGSQDNQYDQDDLHFFQNILKNGGICGRRAFFGRFILRAFGIPTTARPQRAHAALAHWTPDGWVVCLGGGWGVGWTKTHYNKDLDFLATTQARASGEPFMQIKRAQWIGDFAGEPRTYGLIGTQPHFWNGISLDTQRAIIEASKAKILAAVGEDIGEANESKEKEVIVEVKMTDEDRSVIVAADGVITIPAAATSKPTKSTGKIIFLNSGLGGKQLHYSRNGKHQVFEYTFDAPMAGRYALTARVVTPSWKQSLLLAVNDSQQPLEIALPFTVGMWDKTEAVEIELTKGSNLLRFSPTSEGNERGFSIRDFTLTPVSGEVSQVPATR